MAWGAVQRAAELLAAGGARPDAAVAAAMVLEDDPLFNAGTGSAPEPDGEAEMDACVMTGHDLRLRWRGDSAAGAQSRPGGAAGA